MFNRIKNKSNNMTLRNGTKLNNGKYTYEIQSELAKGGFGIVYKAFCHGTNKFIVIKEVYCDDFCDRDDYCVNFDNEIIKEYFLTRAYWEAKKLKSINSPFVVSLIDCFNENNTTYTVMEYLGTVTLRDKIEEDRPQYADDLSLLEEWTKNLLLEIFPGVVHLHGKSIIHRDLSIDNIMVSKSQHEESSRLILIDLGSARKVSQEKSVTGVYNGALSPIESLRPVKEVVKEKVFNNKCDKGEYDFIDMVDRGLMGPWTDVYSLAAIAYYCIKEEWPPKAEDRLICSANGVISDSYEPLGDISNSSPFLKSIDKALAFEPSDRPSNIFKWQSTWNENNIIVTDTTTSFDVINDHRSRHDSGIIDPDKTRVRPKTDRTKVNRSTRTRRK